MGIEQRELFPTSAVPEVAAPQEEGRVVEDTYDILPTHIKGFFLLVDHGVTLDNLTRGQTRGLRDTCVAYGVRADVIKNLQALQKEPHKMLINLGINIPGIRGGRDLTAGIETQINPETTDIFDESLLDASLGERRPEFVHKKVVVSVELDPDKDDVGGFVAAMRRRLRRQGSSPEEAEKRVKTERELRVDKKILRGLIEKGEITLIPGTWNMEIKKWDIVPRKIPTTQELEEAEENTRNSQ